MLLSAAAFPWLNVIDFGAMAHTLRHARAGQHPVELCRTPPAMASLVSGFCMSYHRPAVYAWNCTHLPCAVLRHAASATADCTVARAFRYRCRFHATLAAMRPGVAVVMDGRFTVDAAAFYNEVQLRRGITPPPSRGGGVLTEPMPHVGRAADRPPPPPSPRSWSDFVRRRRRGSFICMARPRRACRKRLTSVCCSASTGRSATTGVCTPRRRMRFCTAHWNVSWSLPTMSLVCA